MSANAMKKPSTVAEYFDLNRYAYLSGVLSQEECARLTQHMFRLKDEGKLTHDPQCPLSLSVYGDPELDAILARLAEPLSQQLGIKLLPTYTYARIYAPGEILKRHLDRESCEISGTLTLGHDPESEIWPIYFSADPKDQAGTSVTIDVGDMVMYRGNELNHWRPAYIGRWQVQVFFHFVDANGPNKNWAFDQRETLGTQKRIDPAQTQKRLSENFVDKMLGETPEPISLWIDKAEVPQPVQPNVVNHPIMQKLSGPEAIYNGVMIPNRDEVCPGFTSFNKKFKPELAFTPQECAQIISIAKAKYPEKARVGTEEGQGKFAEEIRRVDQYKIELKNDTKWIFDKIAHAVSTANHEYYQYELMGITHELQLLHYKADDQSFYDWHTDVGPGHASTRKLSLVLMLSDEGDYEGGDLIVNNFGVQLNSPREQGSINMFPSHALHTVTPVTKGDRWVMVIWVHGSQRFK